MVDPRQEAILAYLHRSQETIERVAADRKFIAATIAIAERIAAAHRAGGKVLLAGNGGSAAGAQHIAADLIGRSRASLAAIALTADSSVLTAIGNHYGFDQAFAHQIRSIGRKGDVFVALSTSGRSGNLIAGLDAARRLGLVTVGFTREAPTPMHPLCDVLLGVPSKEAALIHQLHVVAGQIVCHLVEHELVGAARG